VKYGDMVLDCGTGMSRTFYDWVGSSFGGKTMRRSGAVIALDEFNSRARRNFYEALVVSIAFPDLNRSSKEEAVMTVTLTPERTTYSTTTERPDLGVYTSALPKAWNIGGFRIEIDGLSKECSHVKRISPLRLGQKVKGVEVANTRDATLEPAAIEFSNIALELPGSFADGFYKWADDSLVRGNTTERNGSIDFLAPGSSSPYFSVKLGGLGIYGMSSAKASAGSAKTILPVTVKLYCEEMTFSAGAAAIK
jgi:hypothetical protein